MTHPSYRETTPEGIDLIRWPHKHPLPEAEVIAFFTSRDVTPMRWSNAPYESYPDHIHETQKTLFCIEGEITFSFPDLDIKFTLHFVELNAAGSAEHEPEYLGAGGNWKMVIPNFA